jgi:hypothetical protein
MVVYGKSRTSKHIIIYKPKNIQNMKSESEDNTILAESIVNFLENKISNKLQHQIAILLNEKRELRNRIISIQNEAIEIDNKIIEYLNTIK